jgi:hypothetical protein
MKWNLLVLILFLLVTVSGCAFWDGLTRGLSGQGPVGTGVALETAGQVAGEAVVDAVPFFPSPWKELLIVVISAATGWSVATKKVEETQ